MPPAGAGKRKRGDRSWSGDNTHDGQRPSPHRPNNLNLAQSTQSPTSNSHRDIPDGRGRGSRRASRGGRTTSGAQIRSPVNGSTPMSPPPAKPQAPTTADVRELTATPQPTTNPATSQSRPAPPEPSPPRQPRPFAYEYITNETIKSWKSEGQASLLSIARDGVKQNNALLISSILQELILSGLDMRLDPTLAGNTVKEILMQEQPEKDADAPEALPVPAKLDVQTIFLDTLSILTESEASSAAAQNLIAATGIAPAAMREQLDSTLLQNLGLIRDTFARMGIRKQTNLLYRQANFNLLREESEGFAKLMTELFATSEKGSSGEIVEETVEKVKAMIGAFDLDVGKTLDVVLDIFGSVLVKQYRFFVKFLRRSPWWPRDGEYTKSERLDLNQVGGLPPWAQPQWTSALGDEQRINIIRLAEERDRRFWDRARAVGIRAFFELGRRPAADLQDQDSVLTYNGATPDDEADIKDWIKETGILPPQGNRDAAQLLGFKLRFYSSSAARDQHDTLPDNLIYLSALLIKIGFVSLKDLYPHLWRPDEDMETLRQQKQKEKVERELAARPGAGAKNALLMAGALADDTLPGPLPNRLRDADARASTPSKEPSGEKSKKAEESQEVLPEPNDQKVSLLKSLLTIGALPEALYILGRFPWIVDLYPELPDYIHRIVHHSISKLYEPLNPLHSRTSLRDQQRLTDEQAGLPKGQIKLVDAPARKTMKWALLDREDSSADGVDYRFYWDDWNDNIPVCQTTDDLFTLCDTLVNLSGVRIGQDSSLLVKLARIGRDSLATDNTEYNKTKWIKLCKRLLVPALSLTKANPGIINEVFDLISSFPRETRYSMYTEWFSGRTSRSPAIKAAFDLARAETKDVLKRLSKTNLKPTARTLARIAYANPHVAINVSLGQIEAYDNFAEVVTDGARYFTFLGYDVLSWSLVSSLGRAGRSRVQEGGLLTSRWLSALALFAGKVFKRYSTLNPAPVLQYVANQLQKGNSTDLIIIEQMVLFMAGIVTDTNYNESQLQAMGGGPLLQSQTILQLLDKRHDPSMRTSSRRLMRGLRETGLVGQLLLLIAQQRRKCIYSIDDVDAPLKLLGNLFDEIHRILVQYLDLLRSSLSLEEFTTFVPNVSELILHYGIEAEVAFWISRPTITHQMAEHDKANPDTFEKRSDVAIKEISEADVEMKDEGADTEIKSADTEKMSLMNGDTGSGAANANPNDVGPTQEAFPPLDKRESSSRIWHPVLEELMQATKPGIPEDVVNIIGLPFYTTFWQLSLYDVNIPGAAYEAELTRQNKQIVSNNNDRSDLKRRDERKKQLSELVDNLLAENRQHLKSFSETKIRLLREKDHWFSDMFQKHEALNLALMERCFLPRISLSPLDAFFCFKMIKFLHANGTPNFRTLGFYDLIFREARLTSLMFSCSSKEADNLGRFLNEVLRDFGRWHKDKAVYDREAFGTKRQLPGFAKKVAASGKPETFLDYEDFRKILYKWHTVMHKALKNCLTSNEYMHIRNAISVLKAISQHFPAVNWIGLSLQTTVSDLQKSDKEDVRVPAAALMGDLNRREKEWLIPQAFRQGDEPAAGRNKTPQPPMKPLNAEAIEFKPSPNENSETKTPSMAGAEDGELEDTEMKDAEGKRQEATDGMLSEVKVEAATNLGEEESAAISKAAENEAAKVAAKLELKAETPNPTSRSATPSIQDAHAPSTRADSARPAGFPKRPEPQRPASTTPNPNLPSRPERPESRTSRPGDAKIPSRPPEPSQERRDHRLTPSDPLMRSDRHDDRGRDRSSQLPNGSRLSDRPGYDRGEVRDSSYRDYPEDRHRLASSREVRPRDDHSGRSPRPHPTEPYSHRADSRAHDRDPVMPPPQTASSQAAHSSAINPERAALIGQNTGDRAEKADERRPRGSRPSSPRRVEERGPRLDDRRELSQAEDRRYPRPESDTRLRSDDSRRSRDEYSASSSSQRQTPVDMNYGRLNNEDSRHPSRRREDDGGRPPSSDYPSGPRSRDPVTAPPPRNAPTGPSYSSDRQDRLPPSGPGRPQARNTSSQDQGVNTASQPPIETAGIHPDRLKAFQSPTSEHPSSRQERFEGRPQHTQSQTSPPSAPSGPRGAPSNAPSGPSPAPRGPPLGPQGSDPGRGRGQRNAISAVNNTLQQAGQGTSIRGRGAARTSSLSTTPQQGASEVSRSEQYDAGPDGRPDLFAGSSRHSDTRSDYRDDQKPPPSGRRGDVVDETSSTRRSDRHTTGSRGHSQDRESGSGRRDREATHREGERDRERDHGRDDRDRRDRDKDRERDRDRDRERPSERDRDRDRGSRESSSRRDDRNAAAPGSQSSTAPPSRHNGRREELISQSPSQPSPRGPPLPPQFFEAENARRGTSGSYPPRESESRPPRHASDRPSFDSRDRDRDRAQARDYDRDRDRNDRDSKRPAPPPPPSGPRETHPPSGPGGGTITPQKRGRPADDSLGGPPPPDGGQRGGYGSGGRGPPSRAASGAYGGNRGGDMRGGPGPGPENKRPRRGGG